MHFIHPVPVHAGPRTKRQSQCLCTGTRETDAFNSVRSTLLFIPIRWSFCSHLKRDKRVWRRRYKCTSSFDTSIATVSWLTLFVAAGHNNESGEAWMNCGVYRFCLLLQNLQVCISDLVHAVSARRSRRNPCRYKPFTEIMNVRLRVFFQISDSIRTGNGFVKHLKTQASHMQLLTYHYIA